MQKSLRDLERALAALMMCAGFGCGSMAVLGALRSHPAAIAGIWVDSAKSVPGDTALWVLAPSGDDASQHVRRAVTSPADSTAEPPFRMMRGTHYGYWYFEGRLEDHGNRAICFTNRPGRSAATCLQFDLDSVPALGRLRRRLVVHGYAGAHNVTDRVLLERMP